MNEGPVASPLPISCYIRTKNEEHFIEKTILAARQICAEVIIVDSGSTDRTVTLAKAAGARIVHQPWLGNGFQKRAGEDACNNDWVLDLDADEVISPELAEEIRTEFADLKPRHSVYQVKLITVPPVGDPWHKFLVVVRYKLYDRRLHRMPASAAWDQMELSAGTKFGVLKGVLWHFSFRNLEHIVDKLNGVSTRRAQSTKEVSAWSMQMRIFFAMPFYFFKAYIVRGRWRAGTYGYAMARISAYGRWLRDAKRYEAWMIRNENSKSASLVERKSAGND
jgi:glycosyltransferase involved in cell wall biosynthesis